MLGVICQRLNEELRFDRETERYVGNDRANALLDGPPPHSGWEAFAMMAQRGSLHECQTSSTTW